ncbi:hypothetical protein NDR87_20125 [Nocardia sp. CDC159]|uniref:Uncharacterized protein n=1 Tax=Nocardia pulmonis TaxID=2951408 RepID=A0A9X2EDB8_9NOCA|nr:MULTISPECIES: hypothetical protein [Nocardia]MCM6775996.1 hypothetical protein [Nocardia pulmonis]MCM6788677.1 hypothetical protein [Nocardia sp. CDC159]
MRSLRRLGAALLTLFVVSLLAAGPSAAYAPVDIVHTERVQAGPYGVTVGFSTWPIRAMQSLDFTFMPDDGIAGKSGTLTVRGPGVRNGERTRPLVRHPRKRESWGLDVKAYDDPGSYSFRFVIDGPQGRGEGTLANVRILDQPGPPLALSWTIGSLPLVGLLIFLGVVWRRVRPGRAPLRV